MSADLDALQAARRHVREHFPLPREGYVGLMLASHFDRHLDAALEELRMWRDEPLPAAPELRYAQRLIRGQQEKAVTALVTSEHIETVATMVFQFVDADDSPTAQQVAERILRHLAATIAPLVTVSLATIERGG